MEPDTDRYPDAPFPDAFAWFDANYPDGFTTRTGPTPGGAVE